MFKRIAPRINTQGFVKNSYISFINQICFNNQIQNRYSTTNSSIEKITLFENHIDHVILPIEFNVKFNLFIPNSIDQHNCPHAYANVKLEDNKIIMSIPENQEYMKMQIRDLAIVETSKHLNIGKKRIEINDSQGFELVFIIALILYLLLIVFMSTVKEFNHSMN